MRIRKGLKRFEGYTGKYAYPDKLMMGMGWVLLRPFAGVLAYVPEKQSRSKGESQTLDRSGPALANPPRSLSSSLLRPPNGP